MERLRRIATAHDPRGGDDDTLQGELASAILSLRSQANRDGWMNWGEHYEEMIGVLLKYFCDDPAALPEPVRHEMRRDLEAICEAGQTGADRGRFAYEECDRVALRVLAWCESHRKPITKVAGQDFWYP